MKSKHILNDKIGEKMIQESESRKLIRKNGRDGFIPFTKQEIRDRERGFNHIRDLFKR